MDLFSLKQLNHNQVVDFFESNQELKQYVPSLKQNESFDGKDLFYLYDRMAGTDFWLCYALTSIGMTSKEAQNSLTNYVQESFFKFDTEGNFFFWYSKFIYYDNNSFPRR